MIVCALAEAGCGVLLGLTGDDESPPPTQPPMLVEASTDTGTADGGSDGDGGGNRDGGNEGRCAVSAPFTSIEAIGELAAPDESLQLPRLTPDEKVIYFYERFVNGSSKVFRAQRTSRTQPFGAPVEETFGQQSPRQAIPSADDSEVLFVSDSTFVLRRGVRAGGGWNVSTVLAMNGTSVSTPARPTVST